MQRYLGTLLNNVYHPHPCTQLETDTEAVVDRIIAFFGLDPKLKWGGSEVRTRHVSL